MFIVGPIIGAVVSGEAGTTSGCCCGTMQLAAWPLLPLRLTAAAEAEAYSHRILAHLLCCPNTPCAQCLCGGCAPSPPWTGWTWPPPRSLAPAAQSPLFAWCKVRSACCLPMHACHLNGHCRGAAAAHARSPGHLRIALSHSELACSCCAAGKDISSDSPEAVSLRKQGSNNNV